MPAMTIEEIAKGLALELAASHSRDWERQILVVLRGVLQEGRQRGIEFTMRTLADAPAASEGTLL